MKKNLKICGIIILLLLLAGIILGVIGWVTKGPEGMQEFVDSVTGGKISLNLEPLENLGFLIQDGLDELDSVDYDINDATNFSPEHEILTGQVDKYCIGENVQKLDIQTGGSEFRVEASGDNSFYIEATNVGKLQTYMEEGALIVRTTSGSQKWNDIKGDKITLYVPESFHYSDICMELGAGKMNMSGLDADHILLKAGAGQINAEQLTAQVLEANVGIGQITMNNITVQNLDAEVGAGGMTVKGTVKGDAGVKCSMGSLDLRLAGNETDFNYHLIGTMGNISIAGQDYNGVGMQRDIDNGAGKSLTAECAMGSIAIRFED